MAEVVVVFALCLEPLIKLQSESSDSGERSSSSLVTAPISIDSPGGILSIDSLPTPATGKLPAPALPDTLPIEAPVAGFSRLGVTCPPSAFFDVIAT